MNKPLVWKILPFAVTVALVLYVYFGLFTTVQGPLSLGEQRLKYAVLAVLSFAAHAVNIVGVIKNKAALRITISLLTIITGFTSVIFVAFFISPTPF